MRVRDGGVWREIEDGLVFVDGDYKKITSAIIYDDPDWIEIASFIPDLSLSITPAVAGGGRQGAGPLTTNVVTATPTGGEAPYSYSWQRLNTGTSFANSPNSPATSFFRTMGNEETVMDTFSCACTDGLGNVATSVIEVTFSSFSID